MSAIFSALETSQNGLGVYKTWLDAIADNIESVKRSQRQARDAVARKRALASGSSGLASNAPRERVTTRRLIMSRAMPRKRYRSASFG